MVYSSMFLTLADRANRCVPYMATVPTPIFAPTFAILKGGGLHEQTNDVPEVRAQDKEQEASAGGVGHDAPAVGGEEE